MSLTQLDPSQVPGAQANILDNGGFEIWQRGTSFSNPAISAYTADRWQLTYNSSPTFTVSRESSIIDSGQYALKLNITAVSSATLMYFGNTVENGAAYAGKTITCSIRVKCSSAGLINIVMSDGVTFTAGSLNVGTSYETITHTKVMSASATGLTVFVGFAGAGPAPSVSTIYIDSAMLTVGPNASTFVPMHPQADLSRCQRYYEVQNSINLQSWATAGGNFIFPFKFSTTKRIAPTITFSGGTLSNVSSVSTFQINADGWLMVITVSGSGAFAIGASTLASWTASADF